MAWTIADMPDQDGRVAVVTGGNGGLGYETALALAGAHAHVVIAARDPAKADRARGRILAAHPGARVDVVALDLSSREDVEESARTIRERYERLDLLIDNAGVMAVPRQVTSDGWELQFATNHLGHFALTGLLLDRLLPLPGSRVVVVTSGVHKVGRIRFDDLHGERRYERWTAYAQSKLANALFAAELGRRLAAAGAGTVCAAAHPGYASTDLQLVGPRMSGSRWLERVAALGNRLVGQSAAQGALPQLYAATAPGVGNGDLIGPDRLFELRGHPRPVRPSKAARDPELARRLWTVSEELTGVTYPV